MKIRIDENVLKKTAVFKEILENPAFRAGKCPDISEGLKREFDSPQKSAAADCFRGVGLCIRAETIDFKCRVPMPQNCVCFTGTGGCSRLDGNDYCHARVVDIITGGEDAGVEYVVLAECKFNVKPPQNDSPLNCFASWDTFVQRVAEKFLVMELWEICGTPAFFVLFDEETAPLAERHLDHLRVRESNDEKREARIRRFTVCDLTEFRACFA